MCVCVYRDIFNYLDKRVSSFSLVGDQGNHTARHSHRLSV